jgi:hypothetical protein
MGHVGKVAVGPRPASTRRGQTRKAAARFATLPSTTVAPTTLSSRMELHIPVDWFVVNATLVSGSSRTASKSLCQPRDMFLRTNLPSLSSSEGQYSVKTAVLWKTPKATSWKTRFPRPDGRMFPYSVFPACRRTLTPECSRSGLSEERVVFLTKTLTLDSPTRGW